MLQTIVADHANDKVILFINEDPIAASSNLQMHFYHLLSEWYEKWPVKTNHINLGYIHTSFTLK